MSRRFSSRQFVFVFFLLLILRAFPVLGDAGAAAAESRNFKEWLGGFREEALNAGISADTLDMALSGIEYNSRVIELDRNQPEFTLTLSEYLDRMVSDSRIQKGRKKLAANRLLLQKIEESYGVPRRYLVALWGMESYYCRYTGDFRVIEALATLSFDPRRSLFFKKELLAALHLLDNKVISLTDLRGSWAGALGCLQFLPSVFREYGVDFDKDGRLEIFKAGGDLFASAANYLKDAGWRSGGNWGAEVRLSGNPDSKPSADRTFRPLSFWLRHGVTFKDSGKNPGANIKAALIQPDTKEKRYFLIFPNFEVLLKWNRSDYYAIAAGLLADRIKEEQ